jgi:multidrug resistance efflux pump
MTASPPETVPTEAFQALGTMHQLTLETFLCQSKQELIFRILNRSTLVAPYGRAILWGLDENKPNLLGVSGKADINPRTPLMKNYAELVQHLRTLDTATLLTADHFPAALDTWNMLIEGDCSGMNFLWIPVVISGVVVAGLWLERWPGTPEWQEREVKLLSSLMVAYAAAWDKLILQQRWWQRLRETAMRSRLLIGALILGLAGLLIFGRIPLRIVAPCNVIPEEPHVIAAPLDGVIEEIMVSPDKAVIPGQVLLRYDERGVREQIEVATQQVKIIREQLNRAHVKAFTNPDVKATIPQLKKRLEQEKIRLKLAHIQQEKLVVTAPTAGLVLLDNPHEWKGRRVTTGERILSIVDPAKTKLNIWLPEKDNIDFDPSAPVQVILSSAPNESLEANLDYISKHISQNNDGIPSFRAEALWHPDNRMTEMRIGLTGTAILYGEKVSVGYWLLRKPWAAIRRNTGF